MTPNNQKVIVIGLDGATFDIIDPLIKKGRLPTLAKLIQRGARASLTSTIMPNSYPAWTSCITGVNPGKHSIFWAMVRRKNNAYPLSLMNSFDIKAKCLWHLLGEKGKKTGVINVPVIYPPEKLNGFLVCGALTPDETVDFTYPSELKQEIKKIIPDYKCEIDYANVNLDKLSQQIMGSIKNREKLTLHLMKKKKWDLLFTVFTETDLAQHKFWAGIDPKHPEYGKMKKKFSTFVYDVYERLDRTVDRIIQDLPKNTQIFIISDHGFGPFYQSFSLTQWLIDNNYLALKEFPGRKGLAAVLKSIRLQKTAQKLKSNLFYLHSKLKGHANVRFLREKEASTAALMAQKINWEKTRAYYTPDYGIRLNLKGREPLGIVEPGKEADSIMEKIIQDLRKVTFSNQNPVFEAVLSKEKSYSGAYTKKAPDIVVPINHPQAPPIPEKWKYTMTHPTLTGNHTPLGIFIAAGPGILEGKNINRAKIIDVTPTILYIFKQPLTKDIDGNVILDIFEPQFSKKRHIYRQGLSKKSKTDPTLISDRDTESIKQRLKDLGYID